MQSKYLLARSGFWMIFLLSIVLSCSDDSMDIPDPDIDPIDTTDTTGNVDTTDTVIIVDTIPEFDTYKDWMQELLYDYRNETVTLKKLCIAGSHDAGTYILQNCTLGANECNTQTQDLNTLLQLEAGIRIFDIRPVLKNNVYFTQHTTSCGGLGCKGDRIENMLRQIADFLDEHNELVIVNFGHWCDTGPTDETFRNLVTGILGDRMYTDDGTDNTPFIQRDLRSVIPYAGATGKVLVNMSGLSGSAENMEAGFFSSGYINDQGSYANAQDYETMRADQFSKYAAYSNSATTTFEFSWTLTMDDELAIACANPFGNPTSIADMAATANVELEGAVDDLITSGQIVRGRIPNVIWSDFVASDRTDQTIRISRLNFD